ncbi:MAG: ElyC/SanA/YdcF family protein [Polyangia bacterium]
MSIPKLNTTRNLRRLTAGALGIAAVTSGLALLPGVAIDRRTRDRLFAETERVPPRPVAIVPGCRVHRYGSPTATLADRLRTALDLYRGGRVNKILASGDHGTPSYDEVGAMSRWLERRDVPARDVLLDHAGLRTIETMRRARSVFDVRGAVICTQRFHLPRAVYLGLAAGIDAVGVEADRRIYERRLRNRLRETLARSVAFFEVNL